MKKYRHPLCKVHQSSDNAEGLSFCRLLMRKYSETEPKSLDNLDRPYLQGLIPGFGVLGLVFESHWH